MNPFFLAPMEAVNCASFRVLCMRRGAGLVFTDMIDADDFVSFAEENSDSKAIKKYINPQEDEELAVQIGGGKIDNLIKCASAVQQCCKWVDFNAGCPLGYMLGKKGGAYLVKHPDQLYKIVKKLREVIKCKFSVKIRSGWDDDSINAVEVAVELEKLGVDMICVHPRTKAQGYRDRADWPLVRKVKEAVKIPVALSGDVTNVYMAHMAFAHTKCDYIMLARGARANPSIFSDLNEYWKDKRQPKKPETVYDKKRREAVKDFKEWLLLYKERESRNKMSEKKDHALWTVIDSKNNKELKQAILKAENEMELIEAVSRVRF